MKPNVAKKNQTPEFMIFSGLMLFILTAVVMGLFLERLQIERGAEAAPTRRMQDLVALLKQAETKRESLETEVNTLRKRLIEVEKQEKSSTELANDPELQSLYRLAGFTPVSGQGVVITLQDSKKGNAPADEHADPNAGKLQADDLLKLVNELKAAGASAISINEQRLVTTSEIVTAGPTISVNQTRLTQPVTVKAIGEPDLLMNALKLRGGIMEYLEFFEIKTSVAKRDSITVPAYKGTI